MSTAIDLALPRVIVIEDRGKSYRLTVRRIPKDAWLKYFTGIVNTSEVIDGKTVNSFDSSAARLELAEQNLIGADGYRGDVTAIENWQSLIPLGHRVTVGNTLCAVRPSELTDDDCDFGFESVKIDATWGAAESGGVLEFRGLRHVFKTPSVEHQRRFARDASRSTIVGRSRSGKTVWMGAQATLAELYDELIVSVEGYQVNGEPLNSSPAIVGNMDVYHKFIAADALFAPAMPKFDEEA